MGKARNLADLLDDNGDVKSASLDNVPASNNASALTTGTLPIARIADDAITNAKLATGITASKLTGALPAISAASLTNVPKDTTVGGRKNILINGDFAVSQRGYSSATAVSDNDYTLDRWKMRLDGASATVQQTAVTPWTGKTTNAIKVVATSTASGYQNIRQIVEDYKIVSGQTVTLSAWVRGSGNPLFFRHWGVTNIGSGKALTSSWQKYTETYNVPTLSNTTDGDSGSFTMSLGTYNNNVSITSGDFYEVALFQVEVGSTATDFEHRSYGEELALCQRYYYKTTSSNSGGSYQNFAVCSWIDNAVYRGVIEFPVTMRTRPTFSSTGNFQSLGGPTFSAMNAGDGTTFDRHGIQVNVASNQSAGQSILIRANNDATAALIYDAEL